MIQTSETLESLYPGMLANLCKVNYKHRLYIDKDQKIKKRNTYQEILSFSPKGFENIVSLVSKNELKTEPNCNPEARINSPPTQSSTKIQ